MSALDELLRPRPGETADDVIARVRVAAENAMALVLDAAEEWALALDQNAEALQGHGVAGRDAAGRVRTEATELRVAVASFRPLRRRDPETDEWVEVAKPDLDEYAGFQR